MFEGFGNVTLLREEVTRDIEHGMLTKTAIHPSQIDAIQSLYAVDPGVLMEARKIRDDTTEAVFSLNGAMCELATHRRWAATVVRRAEYFGIRRDSVLALTG
ncbi:HpcH/HpaI aldolase/citrate lyase family protein [Sphingomonas sp. S1-29]|nr:HpcH/HpaI aldolase/citrate lyase family protein [Sphingomonas sp. S1-29]UZK68827.1 HpcH/HpaI aldolase/citrate lyase family protein [Sphingomonas sp. S1-29]